MTCLAWHLYRTVYHMYIALLTTNGMYLPFPHSELQNNFITEIANGMFEGLQLSRIETMYHHLFFMLIIMKVKKTWTSASAVDSTTYLDAIEKLLFKNIFSSVKLKETWLTTASPKFTQEHFNPPFHSANCTIDNLFWLTFFKVIIVLKLNWDHAW